MADDIAAPVTLRLAQPSDARAIHDLTHQAYAKWIEVAGRPPLPMTVDYDQAVLAHRFDLLFEGETLAALIETTAQGDNLLVVNVAVRPGFQGRGYGVRLLGLAEQLAAETGRSGLWLYTNRLFEANIQLYAALGYRVEYEETLPRGVITHMSKTLKS